MLEKIQLINFLPKNKKYLYTFDFFFYLKKSYFLLSCFAQYNTVSLSTDLKQIFEFKFLLIIQNLRMLQLEQKCTLAIVFTTSVLLDRSTN